MKTRLAVLFSFFLLTSCATMYIGKVVRSEQCQKIQNAAGDEHHFELTHVSVDYIYKIDPSASLIYIEGFIDKRPVESINKTNAGFLNTESMVLENKRLKDGYLEIFFLGANREVLDSVRSRINEPFPGYVKLFPIKFKTDHHYNPDYKYIALAYKFVFLGASSKKSTSMEKVYEHRLAIK